MTKLNNIAIESTYEGHAKKIVEYFKSLGAIDKYEMQCNLYTKNSQTWFYMIQNGIICAAPTSRGYPIITLPEDGEEGNTLHELSKIIYEIGYALEQDEELSPEINKAKGLLHKLSEQPDEYKEFSQIWQTLTLDQRDGFRDYVDMLRKGEYANTQFIINTLEFVNSQAKFALDDEIAWSKWYSNSMTVLKALKKQSSQQTDEYRDKLERENEELRKEVDRLLKVNRELRGKTVDAKGMINDALFWLTGLIRWREFREKDARSAKGELEEAIKILNPTVTLTRAEVAQFKGMKVEELGKVKIEGCCGRCIDGVDECINDK